MTYSLIHCDCQFPYLESGVIISITGFFKRLTKIFPVNDLSSFWHKIIAQHKTRKSFKNLELHNSGKVTFLELYNFWQKHFSHLALT